MGKVRLIVLDVMKPHQPNILHLSQLLSDLDGIDGCDIVVYEIDSKVENVKITLQGEEIEYDVVQKTVESVGATIHSIDKVTSGVCLLAKSLDRHGDLTRQFAKRTTTKEYLAVVVGSDLPEEALVDLPLVTASSGRVRIAADRAAIGFDPATATYRVPADALRPGRSYPSQTRFRRLGGDGDLTAVAAEPITGRRHQIRVLAQKSAHAEGIIARNRLY